MTMRLTLTEAETGNRQDAKRDAQSTKPRYPSESSQIRIVYTPVEAVRVAQKLLKGTAMGERTRAKTNDLPDIIRQGLMQRALERIHKETDAEYDAGEAVDSLSLTEKDAERLVSRTRTDPVATIIGYFCWLLAVLLLVAAGMLFIFR